MNSRRKALGACVLAAGAALVLPACAWDFTAECMGTRDPSAEHVEQITGDGSLEIDWENLRNPILFDTAHPIKDQAVVLADGTFFLFSSGGVYESSDLATWVRTGDSIGSPDVTRAGDEWVMTHQVKDERNPGLDGRNTRLVYRTSRDLRTWSEDREIMPVLPPDRHIDGALAIDDAGSWHLGFKSGSLVQQFRTTVSEAPAADESPSFSWPVRAEAGEGCAVDAAIPIVGDTITQWAENYQFIRIDGRWRMIATARRPDRPVDFGYVRSHEPFVYEMDGSGDDPADWRRWAGKRLLDVPTESWNTLMHANSAYLADWRERDGWFYLFYAGTDTPTVDGRGHGMVGVVRSKDLVKWYLPGEMP